MARRVMFRRPRPSPSPPRLGGVERSGEGAQRPAPGLRGSAARGGARLPGAVAGQAGPLTAGRRGGRRADLRAAGGGGPRRAGGRGAGQGAAGRAPRCRDQGRTLAPPRTARPDGEAAHQRQGRRRNGEGQGARCSGDRGDLHPAHGQPPRRVGLGLRPAGGARGVPRSLSLELPRRSPRNAAPELGERVSTRCGNGWGTGLRGWAAGTLLAMALVERWRWVCCSSASTAGSSLGCSPSSASRSPSSVRWPARYRGPGGARPSLPAFGMALGCISGAPGGGVPHPAVGDEAGRGGEPGAAPLLPGGDGNAFSGLLGLLVATPLLTVLQVSVTTPVDRAPPPQATSRRAGGGGAAPLPVH